MSRIKNTSGEDLTLPWLGDRLVLAGQEIDVDDDVVYAYTQQAGWSPVDDAAKSITDDAAKYDAQVAAVLAGEQPSAPGAPAGNASRDEWVAWVVGTQQVPDESALTDLSRDEIRDTYKPKES